MFIAVHHIIDHRSQYHDITASKKVTLNPPNIDWSERLDGRLEKALKFCERTGWTDGTDDERPKGISDVEDTLVDSEGDYDHKLDRILEMRRAQREEKEKGSKKQESRERNAQCCGR